VPYFCDAAMLMLYQKSERIRGIDFTSALQRNIYNIIMIIILKMFNEQKKGVYDYLLKKIIKLNENMEKTKIYQKKLITS